MELSNKKSIILLLIFILSSSVFSVEIRVNRDLLNRELDYHNFYISASVEHQLEEIKDIFFVAGDFKVPLNYIEKNSYLTNIEDYLNLEFMKNKSNPKFLIEVVYKVPGGGEKKQLSEEYSIKLNKNIWSVEGGGSAYHDFSFTLKSGISKIIDNWSVKINGDILITPIIINKYLLCSSIDSRDDNILSVIDHTNGKVKYEVNLNELLGINTSFSIRSMTANVDKKKVFITISNNDRSFLVIHELFKKNNIIIDDLEFTNSIKMMPIRDNVGALKVLVYGYNKDYIYKVYSFSHHGGYELIFKKEVDNLLISYIDTENISSLVKIPRNVYGKDFSIGTLIGNEFYILSDIYNNYYEDNILLENEFTDKFSSYLRFHKDEYDSKIFLNYNNKYYYATIEDNRMRFINTYVENIRTDNFNVLDSNIYTFNYSDGFYLQKMGLSGFVEKEVLLTQKEDYSSEYFVQAFDLAPMISGKYILTIDKNYSLFLLKENKGDFDILSKKMLPRSILSAKRKAEMIPFGDNINKLHDIYYTQPEVIVIHDQVIVTTGEDSPNWIVSYKMR